MRMKLACTPLLLLMPIVAIAAPYQLDPATWQRAVLTEMMVAPAGVLAEAGQWVELQNLQDEPVNLQGMVLTTSSGGFHVISPTREFLLEPGAAATLGRLDDPSGNGGVVLDLTYGDDLLLDRESDVILLLQGSALVDFAVYGPDSIPVEPGRTLSLEPPLEGGFKEWCLGRLPCGDGTNLGTPGQPNTYCDSDGDGQAEDEGDCDDTDPTIATGLPEACNGVDDNCDGRTDDDVVPTIVCLGQGICARTIPICHGVAGWVCAYPEGYEATETLCDRIDNDCDGLTDEDQGYMGLALDAPCAAPGQCGSGVVACRSDGAGATCSTLPDGPDRRDSEEICDGIDNDCNGLTDEGFDLGAACRTGLGACARTGILACDATLGLICQGEPLFPSPELCGDGIDNDCDGLTDEGFDVGAVCSVGLGACRTFGKTRCADDGLGTTCQAIPGVPDVEICGDGIDNDCDGETDESDCARPPKGGNCSAGRSSDAVAIPLVLLLLLALLLRRRLHEVPQSSTPGLRGPRGHHAVAGDSPDSPRRSR